MARVFGGRVTGAGIALIIGIIVVTGLIIWGLFVAREAGNQARRDDAVKVAEQQLEEQSREEVALNESDEKKDENKNESTNGAEQNNGSASEGSGSTIPSTGVDGAEVNELPQTGPAETLGSIVAVGALSFAVAAYVSSRRNLHNSL